jgi:hypothetical protein
MKQSDAAASSGCPRILLQANAWETASDLGGQEAPARQAQGPVLLRKFGFAAAEETFACQLLSEMLASEQVVPAGFLSDSYSNAKKEKTKIPRIPQQSVLVQSLGIYPLES